MLKKRLWYIDFLVKFGKILITSISQNTSARLLVSVSSIHAIPAGTYLLKVNNRNTSTGCEICLKLTIKTPEGRQWRCIAGWDIDILHLETLYFLFHFIKSKFIRCFPVLPFFPCSGPFLVFQLFLCYYIHPFKVSKL